MKTFFSILIVVGGIYLLSIIFSIACAGETSVSIGAGWNGNLTGSSVPWDNGGGVGAYGQLAHKWALSPHTDLMVHWTHISQWDVGPPFNDIMESSVDHVGAAFTWTF